MNAEQNLWLAVLLRVLDDASGFLADPDANRRDRRRIMAAARLWFERGERDFKDVCLMAGCDPSRARAGALAWIVHKRPAIHALGPRLAAFDAKPSAASPG